MQIQMRDFMKDVLELWIGSTQRMCRGMAAPSIRAFRYAVLLAAVVGLSSAVAAPPPQVTNQVLMLDSGPVFVRDSGGRGVPVVFLHPINGMMWDQQIPALIKAGYRFISIDYRGPGGPALPAGVSSNTRIEQTVQALALPRFHLVGTAGGSVAATQFALEHPDQVRSLVVSNSLAGLRDKDFNEIEARLRSPQFDAMPREWKELGPTYRALHPDGVKQWLEMVASPPAPLVAAQQPKAEGSAPMPTAPSPTAPSQPPGAGLPPVTWARLDQLTVPVEMITGDADPYTPPGIMREFVARLKGAQGAVIPDSGHTAYWEAPDAYNKALVAFLNAH
jgi:pimeloyl-ACP methyl ester carboxylesterase